MKQLVEKYREKRKELHVAFMDLEKECNKVCRERLWRGLHECGVDGHLISSMSSLYDGSKACVKLGSRLGEYFEIRRGDRGVQCLRGSSMYIWME